MPLREVITGARGTVYSFIRANSRCPAQDFLEGCQDRFKMRFDGSFRALSQLGAEYRNSERYRPLTRNGKPLWEFKEHDHRVYCIRRIVANDLVQAILLNGWVKDKTKSKEEEREIGKALNLYREFLSETGENA